MMKLHPQLQSLIEAMLEAFGGLANKEVRNQLEFARDTYAEVEYDIVVTITPKWEFDPKNHNDDEFRKSFVAVQQLYADEMKAGLRRHLVERDTAAASYFDNLLLPENTTDASSSSH